MIALVDCISFFASCEKVFRPDLRNRPVIVLSNNDGCIVAASPEAKRIAGLKMFSPYFQQEDLIKKHDIQVFSSNYTLYGDLSSRIMNLLHTFSPEVEVYSVDEAFLNLEGFKDLRGYGKKIKDTIYRGVSIPVSVGIAKSKALAKVAIRVARNNGGVYVLDTRDKIDAALKNTDVRDIWGIGSQYSKKLWRSGINTAYKFKEMNDSFIRKKFTVVGLRLAQELRGIPCIDLELSTPLKKGITSSRSFGKPVETLKEMKEAVSSYVTTAAEKMRSQNLSANHLSIFITTNRFKDEPQYWSSFTGNLPVNTDITGELISYGLKYLERIYKPGYRYKKAGVMLTDLVPSSRFQADMFDNISFDRRARKHKFMNVIDNINKRWGSNSVYYASSGINRTWFMKRKLMSPYYTTRWDELKEFC